MKRFLSALLSLSLFLSILAACGGQHTPSTTPAPEESGTSQPTGENSAYPMTFDNYGRQVTVAQRPEKVLTLGPNCTELFVALGLQDSVIGRSLVNHSRGPLEEYADEVNAIPILNNASVTREAILSSGADFIYALDWEISDTGCNIEEAAQYGITVYVNSATTLEEQYQEILTLGKSSVWKRLPGDLWTISAPASKPSRTFWRSKIPWTFWSMTAAAAACSPARAATSSLC